MRRFVLPPIPLQTEGGAENYSPAQRHVTDDENLGNGPSAFRKYSSGNHVYCKFRMKPPGSPVKLAAPDEGERLRYWE